MQWYFTSTKLFSWGLVVMNLKNKYIFDNLFLDVLGYLIFNFLTPSQKVDPNTEMIAYLLFALKARSF
jgi:hypothetical protein